MKNTKFTKGPWKRTGMDFITSCDGVDICDFSMSDIKCSDDEYEANIDLISKSPELYYALHNLLISLKDSGYNMDDENVKYATGIILR